MAKKTDANVVPIELEELISRLIWLIQLRWLFGSGILLAGLFFSYTRFAEIRGPLLVTIGAAILLYNTAFWMTERRLRQTRPERHAQRAPLAASIQIILDLIALTLVLHTSGGIENPFFVFYLFHIVIATLLLPTRAVFGLAGLTIGLFGALALAELKGWLPHACVFPVDRRYDDPQFVVATLIAFSSALLIAVYLGTSIARTMRWRGASVQHLEREVEKRAEELEKMNEALRALDEAKTRYFFQASHDLKSPLAAQQSLLRALSIELKDLPEHPRSRLERAISRGDELLALLSDLLVLAKTRDVTRKREREWIHPAERLRGVLESQAVRAEEKGLNWRVETVEPLPAIRIEPDILPTLADNVISNAIKYTPPGGTVTVSLRHQDQHLVMQVRDTGIGIAEGDLPRIGHEFFRTRQARESGSAGTGLGMTIVRSIVERTKGQLDIQTQLGKGTTVRIVLPLSPADPLPDDEGPKASAKDTKP